jgi:hypothetical protein
MAIRAAYHESEGDTFIALTGDLRDIALVDEDVSGRVAMHKGVLNASLVIQFSSQRIAAAYHS